MGDDLRIHTRLEDGAVGLQFVPQDTGIHDIAVLGHRYLPTRVLNNKGLSVLEEALTRRRVPHVSDCRGANKPLQDILFEGIGNEPHGLVGVETFPIG